jgi:hypothetical protein
MKTAWFAIAPTVISTTAKLRDGRKNFPVSRKP